MTIWKFTDKELVKITGRNLTDGNSARIPEHISELAGKADTLIAEGNYIAALDIYCSLLAKDTSDKHLLQRVSELKSLVLLSGMRKDFIVLRLEKFLEIIKRRGSEFMK